MKFTWHISLGWVQETSVVAIFAEYTSKRLPEESKKKMRERKKKRDIKTFALSENRLKTRLSEKHATGRINDTRWKNHGTRAEMVFFPLVRMCVFVSEVFRFRF